MHNLIIVLVSTGYFEYAFARRNASYERVPFSLMHMRAVWLVRMSLRIPPWLPLWRPLKGESSSGAPKGGARGAKDPSPKSALLMRNSRLTSFKLLLTTFR